MTPFRRTNQGAQSMDEFFFLGTAVGAIFGVLHAPMVYRNRIADQGGSPQKAGYFAVWAVLLWTLFGAYVLALWLMGAAGMTFSHIRHTVRSKL